MSKEIAFNAKYTAIENDTKCTKIQRNAALCVVFLLQRKISVITAMNIIVEKPPINMFITSSSKGRCRCMLRTPHIIDKLTRSASIRTRTTSLISFLQTSSISEKILDDLDHLSPVYRL